MFKDQKQGDEGGVLTDLEDQETHEVVSEPGDTTNNNVVPSEIPKEEPASLQNESEPEETKTIEETNEPAPPKKVPKNVVTSWADWASKTSTSVKETKKQENQGKR